VKPDGNLRLAAIAYLAGAPQFVGNVIPLLLGAVAGRFQPSPVQLGAINSCYTAFSLAAAATSPWWVPRLPWRHATLMAATVITALFVLSSRAPDLRSIYLLFGFAGLCAGLMGGPANARIGQSANPTRWWSLSMAFQMVAAAVFSVTVTSVLQPLFGAVVGLTSMAAMFLPCVVAAFAYPRSSPASQAVTLRNASKPTPPPFTGKTRLVPLIAAFMASTFFALGGVAYWIFIERIAHEASISNATIGIAIGLSTVAAAGAAAGAAAFSRRLRLLMIVGSASGLLGYAAMLQPGTDTLFASTCLFNIAWGTLVPAFQAVIRGTDESGRFYVAGPATIFLAAVAAGPTAGAMAQSFGYDAVMLLSMSVTAIALVLGLYAFAAMRLHDRATPVTHPIH